MTKPAGAAAGSGGGPGGWTVAQSGISSSSTPRLGISCSRRSRNHWPARFIAEYALLVLRGCPANLEERAKVRVIYPARFELFTPSELIDGLTRMQLSFKSAGTAPQTEGLGYKSIIRQLLLGLPDEEYAVLDHEIESMLAKKSETKDQPSAAPPAGISEQADPFAGDGSAEQAAGEDPTGQSASTMIGNMIPSVE